MKKNMICVLFCIFLLSCQNSQTDNDDLTTKLLGNEEESILLEETSDVSLPERVSVNPIKEGENRVPSVYFDQCLPEKLPEVFAKDIVSKVDLLQYPVSFSQDHKLMFFGQMDSSRNRHLLYSEKIADVWSEPKQISFTSGDEMEPIISPDGKRIYFASSEETHKQKPSELYFVTYDDGLFSDPVKLPETINSDQTEYYISQSLSGNLYFTREAKGIFKSEFIDGNYKEAYQLEFDSSYYYMSHPYIAKDESFILFDARHSNNIGSADLFISFNSEKGFGMPINLGNKINTTQWDAMASLSPNEKFLFFVREEGSQRDVYWVEFNAEDYYKEVE